MIFKGFDRIKGTFIAIFYDEENKKLNQYFLQFSFKNPWFKPRKENIFDNDSWIRGWLFFYVGVISTK